MRKSDINWLSIVSLAITVLLSIFKDETNVTVIYPIIGVVAIVFIINLVLMKTRANKNLSNTAVIAKSKKYTNYLWKLVKSNSKQMAKEVEVNDLKKIDRNNKKVISLMSGSTNSERSAKIKLLKEEKRELLKKIYKENTKYVSSENMDANNPITSMSNMSNETQSKQVCREICATIMSIQRILLQLEQHNLRIKLGKYVIKYSDNIDEVIAAYVDFLGWTNILLGDVKKGLDYVNIGLEYINYKLDTSEKESDDYYKYALLKARALRHIGTTYYTYKTPKDTFVKESLKEAIELLENEKAIKYFDQHQSKKGAYEKMMFGLKYNDLLYDYYIAIAKKDKSGDTLNSITKKVNQLLKDVDGHDVDDHRLVKILTFKNQVERNQMILSNGLTEKEYIAWWDEYKHDLIEIEKILNKNIYFDEAMEVYIYQKIQGLYYNVERIFDK